MNYISLEMLDTEHRKMHRLGYKIQYKTIQLLSYFADKTKQGKLDK